MGRLSPNLAKPKNVNKPCPKCGENILTEDDYETAMYFHAVVDAVNEMTDEEIDDFYNNIENPILPADKKFKVSVDLHKGITFNIEEDATKEKDN